MRPLRNPLPPRPSSPSLEPFLERNRLCETSTLTTSTVAELPNTWYHQQPNFEGQFVSRSSMQSEDDPAEDYDDSGQVCERLYEMFPALPCEMVDAIYRTMWKEYPNRALTLLVEMNESVEEDAEVIDNEPPNCDRRYQNSPASNCSKSDEQDQNGDPCGIPEEANVLEKLATKFQMIFIRKPETEEDRNTSTVTARDKPDCAGGLSTEDMMEIEGAEAYDASRVYRTASSTHQANNPGMRPAQTPTSSTFSQHQPQLNMNIDMATRYSYAWPNVLGEVNSEPMLLACSPAGSFDLISESRRDSALLGSKLAIGETTTGGGPFGSVQDSQGHRGSHERSMQSFSASSSRVGGGSLTNITLH